MVNYKQTLILRTVQLNFNFTLAKVELLICKYTTFMTFRQIYNLFEHRQSTKAEIVLK